MHDVDPRLYTTVIREMIRHENDVTNHRIMWLLIVQGLIANAAVTAGKEARQRHRANGQRPDQKQGHGCACRKLLRARRDFDETDLPFGSHEEFAIREPCPQPGIEPARGCAFQDDPSPSFELCVRPLAACTSVSESIAARTRRVERLAR